MIDPADKQTQTLPLDEQPAKRKRGRPATGTAMTQAEKQRAYRERMKSKQGKNMSERWVHMFWADIVRLRNEQGSLERMVYYGRCTGAIYALYQAEVISFEVYERLDNLIHSAMIHSGNPFVDSKNAGPVIPSYIAIQRDCEDA
ncbi:hypothetical protein G7015_09405 [Pseudomonas kunmingensis]|uniref:hypothetical protein n=1 Tax=Stutzerimonas kunmingensis TaxID=1211807 RepID=UPI0015E39EA6|nr:hypothetical protein [Stutzerimonas kunmingensis]MBA1238692.1 hypothetical protein [Stutzerimonas kunmingensis]